MSKRRKGITVQQYRSELFTRMFEHYVSRHHLEGINNKVVLVDGVAEPYYFHVISRGEHQQFANLIAEGHHRDFDKQVLLFTFLVSEHRRNHKASPT